MEIEGVGRNSFFKGDWRGTGYEACRSIISASSWPALRSSRTLGKSRPPHPRAKHDPLPAQPPPAKTKPDAAALAQGAKRLYDQAATAAVSGADLQALAADLDKLTKDGLKAVCAAIGLIVKNSMKKDEMIREIQAKIEGRQGSNQRSGMTSLPSSRSAEANGAETFASAAGVPVSSL